MINVYVITCKENRKKYVGVTQLTIEKCLLWHFYEATTRNSKSLLHRAIRKYGNEAFTLEHIAQCENSSRANQIAKFFILTEEARTPTGFNEVEPPSYRDKLKTAIDRIDNDHDVPRGGPAPTPDLFRPFLKGDSPDKDPGYIDPFFL